MGTKSELNSELGQRGKGSAAVVDPAGASLLCRLEHIADCFPGALDGEKCSEEEYLSIPRDFGIYDLVDGILKAHDMADGEHLCIQHVLLQRFMRQVRKGLEGISARIGGTVRLRSGTIRIPDFVIGPENALEGQKFSFDCVGESRILPELVVEVTSGNRANDLVRKRCDYAKAGIPLYWIVDRRELVLRCLTLVRSEYEEAILQLNERLESRFFGTLNVRTLLYPPSPAMEERRVGKEELHLREELLQRRQFAEEERRCAEEKLELESRKRCCAEEKLELESRKRRRAEEKLELESRKRRRADEERCRAQEEFEQEVREQNRRNAALETFIRSLGLTPPYLRSPSSSPPHSPSSQRHRKHYY